MDMKAEKIIITLKTDEILKKGKTDIIVFGNSMWPTLKNGERIAVYRCAEEEIAIGDIIVYKLRCDHLVVHRVLNVMQVEEKRFFLTKGDHNSEDDGYFIPFCCVLGRYMEM